MNPITDVIAMAGRSTVARACGVSPAATYKWERRGVLPRTEWTGETNYAQALAKLSGGKYTRKRFLKRG